MQNETEKELELARERVQAIRRVVLAHDVEADERVKGYDHWSATYEQDMDLLYDLTTTNSEHVAVDTFTSVFEGQALGDLKILDLACGTGMVAELLLKKGFSKIDGIDCSTGMLEKAREKKIYGRIICDFLGKNKLDIADDVYDAGILVSAIAPGNVTGDCFPELCRVIKPGGFCLFTIREEYMRGDFKDGIERDIQELCDKGVWTQFIRRQVPDCPKGYPLDVFAYQITDKKC